MNAADESKDQASRYVFLDYLRAAAAWLVVWDHMANLAPQRMGQPFAPAQWVRHNITGPLGIIQDFGWFGVVVFFLISGFIISDRAAVESPYRFVVRRLLRIYPMVAVAVALSIALGIPTAPLSISTILLNVSLVNYLVVPQVVLVGVAWTLIIEMTFYAITALTQFMRGSPHRIAVNLAFCTLVLYQRGAFGPDFGLFATVVSYLPILVMGQVIYWWLQAKRLSWPWGFAYLGAAWGVFLLGVRAIHPEFAPAANSYAISVAYALLLFVALLNVRLPEWRAVRFLSDTSYSVYLLHGLVGEQLLILMIRHHLPVALSIAVAAAVSLAASWVTFRLVERPTQRLARALTRNSWPRRGLAATPSSSNHTAMIPAALAPPPAIDPDAPMIARTERIVVDRPPQAVSDWVVLGALEEMVLPTRRLPGVAGVTPLTPGPWGTPGGRRIVRLTDGAQTAEQVVVNTPELFRYQVWNYTTAAARPVAYAIGEFRFAPLEGGRTELTWTYAFRLRSDRFPGALGGLGRALMRIAFLDSAYAELMRTALKAIKAKLERS